MTLTRNIFSPFNQIDRELDRVFRGAMCAPGGFASQVGLPLHVFEQDESLVLETDVPGVDLDEIELSVVGRKLAIKVEPRADEHGRSRRPAVATTLALPAAVDPAGIGADLDKGVLRITIPKRAEEQPRQIAISQGASSNAPQVAASDDTQDATGEA